MKPKLKEKFDIKDAMIEIQYKTPYYCLADEDSPPDYNYKPNNIKILCDKKEIYPNDSQIDYTKILDYYCDNGKVDSNGNSDGIYNILTVKLKCSVYTKL